MANKYINISSLFITGVMQIKTTMRYHFTPTRMATKRQTITSVDDGETRILYMLLVGILNGAAALENSWAVPQKSEAQSCQEK